MISNRWKRVSILPKIEFSESVIMLPILISFVSFWFIRSELSSKVSARPDACRRTFSKFEQSSSKRASTISPSPSKLSIVVTISSSSRALSAARAFLKDSRATCKGTKTRLSAPFAMMSFWMMLRAPRMVLVFRSALLDFRSTLKRAFRVSWATCERQRLAMAFHVMSAKGFSWL